MRNFELTVRFQTPSAGRWVLQQDRKKSAERDACRFQTPSAGRWVLQLLAAKTTRQARQIRFKPHQRGGGCCSASKPTKSRNGRRFQTPSAGRWVLQPGGGLGMEARRGQVSNPISGEVGAAAGGRKASTPSGLLVSNPISGEVGAAA